MLSAISNCCIFNLFPFLLTQSTGTCKFDGVFFKETALTSDLQSKFHHAGMSGVRLVIKSGYAFWLSQTDFLQELNHGL